MIRKGRDERVDLGREDLGRTLTFELGVKLRHDKGRRG